MSTALLLPLALLLLSSLGGNQTTPPTAAPKQPKPQPPTQPKANAAARAAGKKARATIFARDQQAAANAPKPRTEQEAAAQAAVDATVAKMVRELSTPSKAAAQPPAATPAKPVIEIDVPKRNAADAAVALRDYLKRTRKFGSKKNPAPEVKAAQADMGGLTVDGIVGPKTRARAKALGVTLPT